MELTPEPVGRGVHLLDREVVSWPSQAMVNEHHHLEVIDQRRWAQRRWAPGPGVSYAPKLRRWGHYCTHLREGQINSKARAERRNAALRVNC